MSWNAMHAEKTQLQGLVVLQPSKFSDERGWFAELWNKRALANLGIETAFVQDNHSVSTKANTVRGLHYQAPPFAQDKLVRCGAGRLVDIAVDIRKGSPTFGASITVELTPQNGTQLYIPVGFAHGFITLEPETEILYKCSNFYEPRSEGSIQLFDPALGLNLGVRPEDCVLSAKDAAAPMLGDIVSPFEWQASE
ncbi:MAG: dTDP-4-dehydrorhamnose 3,5-epimerase [Pseudomonadota bacterium]